MKLEFSFLVSLLIMLGCYSKNVGNETDLALSTASETLVKASDKMVEYIKVLPFDSLRIPRALESDGSLIASNARQWTSGFFPGSLWQLYSFSKDPALLSAAKKWTSFIENQKWDTHTHDLGFKINSSFGKGFEFTKDEHYKEVVIQASKTLIKRFNPKIESIRSWDWNTEIWQFPVIIDNMMNLEMLFEATEFTGDSIYYQVANAHAKTAMQNHMREDHSSYHVIDYDTISGEVRLRTTHQGFSDKSAWARGQAWALYGFTTAYGKTNDMEFLEQAKAIAQFIFNHPNLPEDKIPYWDFDAPKIPNEPRDVSAACIIASALLELMDYDTENAKFYLNWVDHILTSLSKEEYQSNTVPFILDHSTGSIPGNFEIDVPIVYADYYYIEALLKRIEIDKQ